METVLMVSTVLNTVVQTSSMTKDITFKADRLTTLIAIQFSFDIAIIRSGKHPENFK